MARYASPLSLRPSAPDPNTNTSTLPFAAYIDTSLVGTHNVDRAAIFSATGDSVWATSPSFNVSPQEMQAVVTAYKDPGDATGVKKVQSEGLHIAGERFVVLKADERSIYGKKVRTLLP